ncbi:MAG: tRNA (adenosine(37)-N6)-dimethylallyltransferase MiaA [Deltaproteobacteria bacterium]|nr:tRNA (adenosine(37)-N6)-dimethylallyltransferase MiaA [Deltaproteobacteria bacterium]
MTPKKKIIVLAGPTATGKTAMAVRLALEANGEIISCDSRQVFKGMDIGTGKDLSEYKTITHHLIDITPPGKPFSVSSFQSLAIKALGQITARNKLPVICGGTGHYLKALIEDYAFDEKPSDPLLTEQLEKLERSELYLKLKEQGLWEERDWEKDSLRRMARTLEKKTSETTPRQNPGTYSDHFSHRIFLLELPRNEIRSRIKIRLEERFRAGMIGEVEGLLKKGVQAKQLLKYGLEYKWICLYLTGEIPLETMKSRLYTAICRFAKRQDTFFRYLAKNGHEIHPVKNYSELIAQAQDWLSDPST